MKTKLIYLLCALVCFCACDDIIEKNTPENVFEVFWRTLDENYVYFEEKGIDWDSIYSIYAPQARAARNDDDLKRIFGEIIPLFKDKHLSIYTNGRNGGLIRYVNCEQDTSAVGSSLGTVYVDGFKRIKDIPYSIVADPIRRIAYVYINTFNYEYYARDVENTEILNHPEKNLSTLDCSNGLIIDLRDNDGGWQDNLYNFISSFYTGKKTALFEQHKTGKGHSDFGSRQPVTVSGRGYVPDSIPVVILTSVYTYSAANFAVYMLTEFRKCTVIGEATGGGGGGRWNAILPNGWNLSYPCNRDFSPSGKNMEYPCKPDIYIKHHHSLYDNEGYRILNDTILMKTIQFLENLQKNK